MVLGGQYTIWGLNLRTAMYKTSALPTALSLGTLFLIGKFKITYCSLIAIIKYYPLSFVHWFAFEVKYQ